MVPRYLTNCKWDDTQRNIIKSNNDLNIIYYFVQFLMVLSETFSSDQTYICRSGPFLKWLNRYTRTTAHRSLSVLTIATGLKLTFDFSLIFSFHVHVPLIKEKLISKRGLDETISVLCAQDHGLLAQELGSTIVQGTNMFPVC